MNVSVLKGQKNNFDALRLLFASTVVLVHVHVLTGFSSLAWISRRLNAELAVHGFFVISGFLITWSYQKNPRPFAYGLKRLRRIYPAYVTVILVSVVGGLFLTSTPVSAYLASGSTLRYVLANLSFLNFLQPSLPGVFEASGFDGAVNGSLWSIKIEVLCYALVPLLAPLARRVGPVVVFVAVYLMGVALGWLLDQLHFRTGSDLLAIMKIELSAPIACFASGAVCFYCFEKFYRWSVLLVVLAAVAWVVFRWSPLPWARELLEPACLAIMILFAAYRLPCLGNFGRFGDLSYGIYIYHFPIIRCMVDRNDFAGQPFWFLVVAVLLTTAAAFLSWHLVEKRWLRRDSHYVLAQTHRGIAQVAT